MTSPEEPATATTRRPRWTEARWWRQPLTPVYVAALVLALGRGAWFTSWALFFTRYVGLTPAEFGFGITAAGVTGLLLGSPVGYLADRVGTKETLIVLGVVQGLALLSFSVVDGFWAVMASTCVMIAAERAAPGVRIAVVSGLTSGAERLDSIATTRVAGQVGIVFGAALGGVVLSLDTKAAYLGLVIFYGTLHLACAVLHVRVPHVRALRERKVVRRVLVLRDRPFLLVTFLSGLLALNWGMLDSGVPLWISHHSDAPLWILGVLLAGNAIATVLFQRRMSKPSSTVRGAARLALWSGVVMAVSCLVFAGSFHRTGATAITILLVAGAIHVLGELWFVAAGWGLSVGMTPEEAHGEYQGVFNTGYAAAMILSPGVMTLLLVQWAVVGWYVLAGLYLIGGIGTVLVVRGVLRRSPVRGEALAEA